MKICSLTFLLLISSLAFSQSGEITILGRVLQAGSKKPIKAKVTYKSIPTGSITGTFYDSIFQFSIFGTARYQIMAAAEGYTPRVAIVDPTELGGAATVARDITLVPIGETLRLEHLIFNQGEAEIQPESFDELDEICALLKENATMRIQLEGHTDNVGSASANLRLSEQRVEAVKKYFTTHGISKARISTRAFGGSRPLQKLATPEARELNRRVEVRVLSD